MSLSNQILSFLKTQEGYKQIKQYVEKVGNKDQNVYQPICDAIIQALKQKEPVLNLMTARLCKETVDQRNSDFNNMFQEICLPYLEKIAEFRKEDQSEDRGKFYFSENPDKTQVKYGISFLKIVLEGLEVWAKIYTNKSDQVSYTLFFLAYARLTVKKVKFPEKYNYFNKEDVEKNTSAAFKSLPKNLSQILEENKSILKSQQQPLIQQIQGNQQIQIPKPYNISTPAPVNENPKEINQSAQLLINQFSTLKTQLIEKALNSDLQASSPYIKNLREVNQSLILLMEKIDIKVEELLSQDDEDSSLELLSVQDELKIFCQFYQQLQKDEISPIQYRNKFEKYRQQIPKQQQQKGNLQSIYEETENSQSSMQFGKVEKKIVPNINIDSIGLQYNAEQVMHDFQVQLSGITEQYEKEKLQRQQEHDQEVANLKRQIQEQNSQKNALENQVQELKRKEARYKEIEQQYQEAQRQRNDSSQSSDEVKRINTNLTDQIRTLKFQIEQLQSLSEKDNKDIDQMRTNIAQLKEENEQKKQEIEIIKKQHNQEKIQLIEKQNQQNETHKQEIKQLSEQIKFSSYSDVGNLEKTPNREIIDLQKRLENEKKRSTNLISEMSNKIEQINLLEQELKAKKIELEQYKSQCNIQQTAQDIQNQQQHQAEIQKYKQQILELEIKKRIDENHLKEKLNLLEQQLQILNKENEKMRNQTNDLISQKQELNEQLVSLKNQKLQEQIQIEPQKQQIINNLDLSKFKETGFEYVQVQPIQSVSSKQNYSQPYLQTNSNKREKPQFNAPYSGYQHFQLIQFDFVGSVSNINTAPQQNKVPVQNEILYPYLTAEDYYENKVRPHKGIVVPFKNLLPNLVTNQNNLLLYKIYHLNKTNNTIFLDSQDLKIAVVKQVQKHGSDYYINYGLYFKTDLHSLSFKAHIKNSMNYETLWMSQTEVQQNLLKRQQYLLEVSIKQNQQEIAEVPILELNYNNKIQQVCLPIQILSLIQYQKINKLGYQRRWKVAKIYRSEEFKYDTKLLSHHNDITKINECFTISNPEKIDSYNQGLDEIKYFAQFKLLYCNLDGIIKFELMPNYKMIIFLGVESPKQISFIRDLLNAIQDIFA